MGSPIPPSTPKNSDFRETISKLAELALPNAGAARFGEGPPGLEYKFAKAQREFDRVDRSGGGSQFAKAKREFDLWFISNSWPPGISHKRRSPGAISGLSIHRRPESVFRHGWAKNDIRGPAATAGRLILGSRRTRGGPVRRKAGRAATQRVNSRGN